MKRKGPRKRKNLRGGKSARAQNVGRTAGVDQKSGFGWEQQLLIFFFEGLGGKKMIAKPDEV